MYMNKNIRWKQRFQNFEKSFLVLERTVQIPELSEAERGGLIQFFEIAFELSWKTLKDYLESQGFSLHTPKEVLKQAYQVDLLKDGHAWMDALDNRNLTVHTYDEATSLKMERLIRDKYYPLIKDLYKVLKNF